MLPISDTLKNIFKTDIIPLTDTISVKTLTLYFPDLDYTITNDKIKSESLSLDESICGEENLVFGACISSQFKITVANIDMDLSGQKMIVSLTVNNTYDIPFGTYIVKSCERQDNLWFRDIIAYDEMQRINIDVAGWYNGLTFPLTAASFRSSFLAYVGLVEDTSRLPLPNDNMTVAKTIEPSQLGGRTVIEACEAINGCFGHMGRDGKFTHVILAPAYGLYPGTFYPGQEYPHSETDMSYVASGTISETITSAMMQSIKFEEYTVKEIDKLIIRQEENDVGCIYGTGTNVYVIQGNFLVFGKTAAELAIIAANVSGYIFKRPYRPYQSNNIGLPYVEVGDMLTFDQDDAVTGYVFQRTLTGIQALKDEYTAEGSEQLKQNFGTNNKIIQLEGKYNKNKNDIDGLTIEVGDLADNTAASFVITNQNVSAEVSRATGAEGTLDGKITVNAGAVSAEVSRATGAEGTLSGRIDVTASDILLRVEKSSVIASINLSAEAATIKANKINFNGYATFDVNGNITKVNGSILETGTVVADTVRADWVYTNGIKADQITAGTIKGIVINGATITGSSFSTTGTNGTATMSDGWIQSQYMRISNNHNTVDFNNNGLSISNGSDLTVIYPGTISCPDIYNVTYLNNGTPITTYNMDSVYGIQATRLKGSSNGYVYVSVNNNIRPFVDLQGSNGTSDGRWTSIYAQNGTIQTSDARKKTEIKSLSEKYLLFAKKLLSLPRTFKMIDGQSGRTHAGFVAQDVEAIMTECELTDMEFAGLIKSPVYAKKILDKDGNETPDYDTTSEIIDYNYGLRYDEFVPLLFALFNETLNTD